MREFNNVKLNLAYQPKQYLHLMLLLSSLMQRLHLQVCSHPILNHHLELNLLQDRFHYVQISNLVGLLEGGGLRAVCPGIACQSSLGVHFSAGVVPKTRPKKEIMCELTIKKKNKN